MTAQILVVDDIPANVKLLEAKLSREYYDVISADNGMTAYEMAQEHKPDIILLDVMMPGIDGFETCRKLKDNPTVSHIPVVMVTALSDTSDRVSGLEAGADDFITKPINDTSLFARVRSLVRIKVLMDELRLRDKTGLQMGVMDESSNSFTSDVSGSHIILVDDDFVQSKRINTQLGKEYRLTLIEDPAKVLPTIEVNPSDIDLVIISTQLEEADGLRIATQIKSIEEMRHVPVVMMIDEDDSDLMLKGLDLGINDYLMMPVDENEMMARIKTQIRRKKYQDALKSNYQNSVSMAITDQLTNLYNRHYLDAHFENMVAQSLQNRKELSIMIMDMDHFKLVNDNYGHDVGDEVLRQLAKIITDSVRVSDLAARFGGEEFIILLPETDHKSAYDLAERIRKRIEMHPFKVDHEIGVLHKTTSIGVASIDFSTPDTATNILKRADKELFIAKEKGRNRVFPEPEKENTSLELGF